MRQMNSRYAGTCGSCKKGFPKGTLIDYDRGAPRGLKAFHVNCERPSDGQDTRPTEDASDRRYKYFAGDNRPFVMTRYGWRTGREHTGQRCEDAPCCGCCDY